MYASSYYGHGLATQMSLKVLNIIAASPLAKEIEFTGL